MTAYEYVQWLKPRSNEEHTALCENTTWIFFRYHIEGVLICCASYFFIFSLWPEC